MKRNLLAACLCLAALLPLLVGCGTSSRGAAPTATKSAARPATGADVASGCWTAAERVVSTGGNDSMAQQQQWSKPPKMEIDQNKQYDATLQTNKGNIEVQLFPKDAPQTVNNFVCLAKAGYYDNTPFHRIVAGFVIQGGDPTGTGRGGPGYTFNDEPVTRNYTPGTLAMANAGPNTNGSQFFIVLSDLSGQLPKNYTIFGQVTNGMDVVNKIAQTPTKVGPSGEKSVPTEPVTLENVTIKEG